MFYLDLLTGLISSNKYWRVAKNLVPLLKGARSKSRKSQIFFPRFLNLSFLFLAVGQNRKLGNKKTRNNFSEISEISDYFEISICHFFIFFLIFFLFYKCFLNLYFTYVITVLHFVL